jgi:hypothetical protein
MAGWHLPHAGRPRAGSSRPKASSQDENSGSSTPECNLNKGHRRLALSSCAGAICPPMEPPFQHPARQVAAGQVHLEMDAAPVVLRVICVSSVLLWTVQHAMCKCFAQNQSPIDLQVFLMVSVNGSLLDIERLQTT